MLPHPTVYHGAVINPKTLTSLQASPNCLLAVSSEGDIAWIVDNVPPAMVQETLLQHGCQDADVVALKRGEFIMPGFIDTHTVRLPSSPLDGSFSFGNDSMLANFRI
jgi:guanine deaminase